MDKQKVQTAITNLDNILGKAKFTDPILSREEHTILAQNLNLLQEVCKKFFEATEAQKYGRTDTTTPETE